MSHAIAGPHPSGGVPTKSSEERLRELAASTPDAGRYRNLFDAIADLSGGRLYCDSHAKTAVIDGVWSTVGSSNLDARSFLHNDEVNAVILGHEFARQMERQFERDLEECNAVKLEDWKRRPVLDRVRERVCRLLSHWI